MRARGWPAPHPQKALTTKVIIYAKKLDQRERFFARVLYQDPSY